MRVFFCFCYFLSSLLGFSFVSIIYLFLKEYEDFDKWIEEIVYLVLYQVIFNKTLNSNKKRAFYLCHYNIEWSWTRICHCQAMRVTFLLSILLGKNLARMKQESSKIKFEFLKVLNYIKSCFNATAFRLQDRVTNNLKHLKIEQNSKYQ